MSGHDLIAIRLLERSFPLRLSCFHPFSEVFGDGVLLFVAPFAGGMARGGLGFTGRFCRLLGGEGLSNVGLETFVLAVSQARGGAGDGVEHIDEPGLVGFSEVTEHPVVDQLFRSGVADAKADADIVVAEVRGDGAQAVMAGIAAAGFDAQFGRSEVQLVVQHDDVGERDFMERGCFLHGATAVVHIGLRLEEESPRPVEIAFGDQAGKLLAPGWQAIVIGDAIERHKADVVTVKRIFRAGIAEADNEFHGSKRIVNRE
jgi:hypothetical protein